MKFGLYALEGHSKVVDWITGWIKVLLADIDMKFVKGVKP